MGLPGILLCTGLTHEPAMNMNKIIAFLCCMLMSSTLAGCIEGAESPVSYLSSSDCTAIYHVEFFDSSNDEFNAWEGQVEFVGSDGTEEVISDFSSEKKYVFLDESITWTMEYTFFESDIGFMANGIMYGGNNQYGESGTVDLVLTRHGSQLEDMTIEEVGGVTFSDCGSEENHVEFFDLSAFHFCCWDGDVEFTADGLESVSISSFPSEKKYVTLEEGHVWTMTYTFYEGDIGFIVDGEEYGGNNRMGDSGSITIDLS